MRRFSVLIVLACALACGGCAILLGSPGTPGTQCLSGDCMNGYGTTQAPDGSTYTGNKLYGMANGQGTLTMPNGLKYVGEFRGGKPNGQGTLTSPDGLKYEGEFRDGKPNGQGIATSPDGLKYEGEFRDGNFNGHGTATAPDGRKYVGQWRDSKRNGQGTTTYVDGRVLSGLWADTKKTRELSPAEFASILPVGAVQVQVGKSDNLAAERQRLELEKQRLELEKQELAAETVERQRLDAEHQKLEAEKQRIKLQKAQLAERPNPSQIDGPKERRVALVIGNAAYKVATLKNPVNDARDMAKALGELGFEVMLKENANHKEMEEAVRAFGNKLKQGGLGLFYFAGHGVQLAGENYLVPVDAKIESEADARFGSLNAGLVLGKMEDAGNGLNIVILDACRNNPFGRGFRSVEPGLAKMDAPKGSLIAYATAPGKVAADGDGRNGVYTTHLLRHMRTPGLKVEEVLKRVRTDVVRETVEKQIPWESSSLIGEFYFASPPPGQEVQAVAPQPPLPVEKKDKTLGDIFAGLFKRKEPDKPQVPVVPFPTAPQPVTQAPEVQATPVPASEEPSAADADLKALQEEHKKQEEAAKVKVEEMLAKGLRAAEKKNFAEAMKWYRKAAGQGDALAQLALGAMYADGRGVPQNYAEAVKWYRLAAGQGVALARGFLGEMYAYGQGVPQDYAEAVNWYRKAAEQGDAKAQFNLGVLYAQGQGVSQNYAEAAKWYRLAAEQGNIIAQNNLGVIYDKGQGVPQNHAEAAKWYRLAAEQGHADAQCNLSASYALGQGVQQDYSEAVRWTRKAAEQGLAQAQYNLGASYALGEGVPQNYSEAVKWTRKAAEQGLAAAQYNLGASYGIGNGVPQDYVLAYMWSSIAAAQGYAKAVKNRDLAASKMTPAQIAEAQKLASKWRPKTPEELGFKPTVVAGAGEEPTARGGGKVAATSKKNKARQ